MKREPEPRGRLAAVALLALGLWAGGPARPAMAQPVAEPPARTTDAPARTTDFVPQTGQAGKDVIWVPTPQTLVDRMLEMAGLTKDDYVIDLGSGDGRTVITAAKAGARAHGIEYNADMVVLARQRAREAGVADRATFERADIFKSDFSKASLITLFLLTELNLKLRPTLLQMKPGTRIASNTFDMGDWDADETVTVGSNCNAWCRAYLWIVPARVDGRWTVDGGDLVLEQTFQKVEGTLTIGAQSRAVEHARLKGEQIRFSVGGIFYNGTVAGDRMGGTTSAGASWSATRAGPRPARSGS